MPPPLTISQKSALRVSRSHLGYTLRKLDTNPLTKSLAVTPTALLAEWKTVYETELDLQDQVDYAAALVVALDRELNRIAKRVSKELLTITGDDTSHSLYAHYFNGKQLNVFIRPILGKQLEAMRAWVPSLLASDNATLKSLGQELDVLIKQADAAVKARADAEAASDTFRDIGARYQFINKVNAAQKTLYGALAAMPHDNVGLASNFADGFFLRSRVKDEVDDEPTVESVEEEIKALSAELESKQAALAALKAAREAAEKKAQDKTAAAAKVAQLEKDIADKQKELAELTKDIDD